jgi:hypothetical protein
MATRRILFSLFLLVGVCCAQEYGSISGTVTGEDGKPVSSAAVYAFRLIETKAIWIGAIPERETDADGHYSFERLEYGSYHLIATKADAGYADGPDGFFFPFDQQIEAVLSETNSNGTVDLKLGKKVGIVAGTVRDAATGAPIDSYVEFRCLPDTRRFRGERLSAQFSLNIPSDTPVTMKAIKEGYEDWWYTRDGAVAAIQAKPGETVHIDVQLRPKGTPPNSN